jgi:hypothetical protein
MAARYEQIVLAGFARDCLLSLLAFGALEPKCSGHTQCSPRKKEGITVIAQSLGCDPG